MSPETTAHAGPTSDCAVRGTVAVLTYRRPEHITPAVRALHRQAVQVSSSADGGSDFEFDVLVVDNDPAASAEPAIAELRLDRVRYVHEPRPGIAAARNRALAECADRRLIVFIDDDGRPSPDWLRGLLQTWRRYDEPAGVAGWVDTAYSGPVDPWIAAGRFFVRPRKATGTPLAAAASSNLLLDLDQVRTLGLTFDPRLGLAGGEDTLLTRSLTDRGARIVASAEASVVDLVAVERLTRAWVLRRALSHGNTRGALDIALSGGHGRKVGPRVRTAARGLARLGAGTAQSVLGLLARRPPWQARGARTAGRGLGMTLAALSLRYVEYSRDRGPLRHWSRLP